MRIYKRIINYRIRIAGVKSGFTLAEVLITLTIIGVIAALTIPALITSLQDAQYRTAWRGAASMISQAARKLTTDNGGSLNGVFQNTNDVRDKLSNYLSYTQKCDTGVAIGQDGCWVAQMFNVTGSNFTFWLSNGMSGQWSRMVLTNGMLLSFALDSGSCTYTRAVKQNACAQIGVDVNGFKGPNALGKDIYFGYVTADGSYEPFGKQGDFWSTNGDSCYASNAYGFVCSAQYLYQ